MTKRERKYLKPRRMWGYRSFELSGFAGIIPTIMSSQPGYSMSFPVVPIKSIDRIKKLRAATSKQRHA